MSWPLKELKTYWGKKKRRRNAKSGQQRKAERAYGSESKPTAKLSRDQAILSRMKRAHAESEALGERMARDRDD